MISTLVTEDNLAVNFPRLMRSINNPDLIVLFANPSLGTVVSVGHGEEIHTVADISDGWDSENFTLFEGELSLCNEADLDNDSDDGYGDGVNYFDGEGQEDDNGCCGVCQGAPAKDIDVLVNGKTFDGSLDELLGLLGLKPVASAGAARG